MAVYKKVFCIHCGNNDVRKFGVRKDKQRYQCHIGCYFTDDWGAYSREIKDTGHIIGKNNTQRIERKNLNFRTRIKRLARKTICFSRSEIMHDTVIALFINRYEFGRNI